MRIGVAGGSIGGMAAALALARAGHEVEVFERDAWTAHADPADMFSEHRPGTPQFEQPHAFLARGRRELLTHAPDVYDALISAGAIDVDQCVKFPEELKDPDLRCLCVRRPLIEWALRAAVHRETDLTIHPRSKVTGFDVSDGAQPHVRGLVADGQTHAFDLVVDAMGRNSPGVGWLNAVTGRAIKELSTDCNMVYYARYFRYRDGVQRPVLDGPIGPRGDIGYAGFGTFWEEGDIFAVLLITPPSDHALRILRQTDAWMAFARACPPVAPMVDADFAEPITPVIPMGHLYNTFRDFAPGGRAVVGGYVPVGDVLCHTNPSYAAGLSLSLSHAFVLPDIIENASPDEITGAYLGAVAGEARERHRLASEADDGRARIWRGEDVSFATVDDHRGLFMFYGLSIASMADPAIALRTLRRGGLLDDVATLEQDRPFLERASEVLAKMLPDGRLPKMGPPRDEMLALIGA